MYVFKREKESESYYGELRNVCILDLCTVSKQCSNSVHFSRDLTQTLTYGHTNRQADRDTQSNKLTHAQTNRHTHNLTNSRKKAVRSTDRDPASECAKRAQFS